MKVSERETLAIDEKKKDVYELLRAKLGNVENKTAFLVAMSYGFNRGTRMPLEQKVSWVRTSYLNDEDKCLMVAVVLGSQDELPTEPVAMNDIYTVVEEYARGGVALLRETLEDPAGFEKQFMLELMSMMPQPADESTAESAGA